MNYRWKFLKKLNILVKYISNKIKRTNMRIILYVFALMMLVACSDKKEKTQHMEWEVDEQNQPQKTKGEQTATAEEETGNVFKPAKLEPINESKGNVVLRKFLKDLLKVIEKKDVKGLKTFIDPNIQASFGGDKGIDDFIEMWELDIKPQKSMVWQELKNAILLGGTFNKDNENAYYTPYLHTRFPSDYDAFEYAAITGNNVNIRDKPSTGGNVVTKLSYDIVKVLQYDMTASKQREKIGDQTHDWMKIQMADGKTGYVWGKFCRSSIDYRAGFAKVRDEGWKMTFFVAGD